MRIFLSKATKFFIALLVLPVFKPLAWTIWHETTQLSESTLYALNPISLCLGGMILWVLFSLFFHLPLRVYIFAHELTHALFIKLYGGKIKKVSVQSNRGYVVSNKTNFLITLSPYLFPFYAVFFGIIGTLILTVLRPPYGNVIFWVLLGVCLGYHWMMTGKMLTTHQSDFTSQGYFFSFVLILLVNFALFLLLLFLLHRPELFFDKFQRFFLEIVKSYSDLFAFLKK